jgi:capsular polysaccharide biosynthesis protein
LYDYLMIIRARLAVFVIVVFFVVDVSAVLSALATPKYTAKTTILFSSSAVSGSDRSLSEGLLYTQTLVRSYAEVATQPLVLEPVIRNLRLETTPAALARSVSAVSPLGTAIIEIRAIDPSPRRSLAVAQAVARQLALSVDQLAPSRANQQGRIRATTVAPGIVSTQPTSPRTSLSLKVALLWGILAGTALCIWLESVDPRVRSRRDLGLLTDTPAVGHLPGRTVRSRAMETRRLGRSRRPYEQLAQLLTNFGSVRESNRLSTVLFVSPKVEDQPRRAMAGLGILSAQAGASVLLVDADLRTRKTADEAGLSSVLAGEVDWRTCLTGPRDGPPTLLGGRPLIDPSAALASPAMAAFLAEVRAEFDLVLLAAPPVLTATDGLALSTMVDGVFVVADRKDMRRVVLRRALDALRLLKAPVSGVILAG